MTDSPANPERTQANRRRVLRRPLIVLQAKIDDGRRTFFGYAKNLSKGGMFIASVNPQEPGSQFRVEFSVPETRRSTTCNCEVVWKRPYSPRADHEPGMGLKFLDLPDESAEAIDAWAHAGE